MTMEYECGSFKRNSSIAPSLFLFIFYIFLWPHWLFLFISHLSSLGSFNLSSLGSFVFYSLGSFPHFKGNTLYFTRSIEDHHTLQEVLNIKKTENYHDVCKCMPLLV